MMRIAYLWGQWTGYMSATTEAISRSKTVQIEVLLPRPDVDPQSRNRPFDIAQLRHPAKLVFTAGLPKYDEVKAFIDGFQPHVIIASGWNYSAYMKILREGKGRYLRVLSMDNQWRWKPKQVLGIAAAPLFLRPSFDLVFGAGGRQRNFAQLLGFEASQIFEGYLSCDVSSFSSEMPNNAPCRRFVYVGRLTHDKGIAELIEGYKMYRMSVSDPWPLEITGSGPMVPITAGQDGIIYSAFKQPQELAIYLQQGGCFVLASKTEPWGVVLHEAASAGMPLISSGAVGSSDLFLRSGWNGVLLDDVTATSICKALQRISSLDHDTFVNFGLRSRHLAFCLTPDVWAQTFWNAISSSASLLDGKLSTPNV